LRQPVRLHRGTVKRSAIGLLAAAISTSGSSELLVGNVGGSNSASYVKFAGLVGQLTNHTIFGAQLQVVNYDAPSCKARPVTVHPVTQAWTSTSSFAYPGPSFGAALGSSSFAYGFIPLGQSSSACPAKASLIDLGAAGRKLVQGWVDGQPNNGLSLRASVTDSLAWKRLAGTGTANAPRLYITHSPYNAAYKIPNPVPNPPVLQNQNGVVKVTVTNSGVNLSPGRVITQSGIGEADEASDAFGAAVAMGDVNNDRKAEALIGASGEAPTGLPNSGVVVAVSGLAGCGTVAVDQNSRVTAMQIAPQGGAAVGTLEYGYVDNIGRLVQGHQTSLDDFSSVVWTVISNQLAFSGQPALGQFPDGRVQVAGRNIDTAEWTNTQTGTPPAFDMTAWMNQGGLNFSPPAVAREADGRLILFATDANGRLWTLTQKAANGTYGVWTGHGAASLVGTPTVVKVSNGIQVFARDTAGAVKTALLSGGTLSAWTSLGGTGLTGSPSVVVSPGFSLRVFIRAADGSILTKKQDAAGAWPATWSTVSGFTSAGSPAALLAPVTGRTEVVARGNDGVIYSTGETSPGSGTWRDWVPVSSFEVAVTDPTAFTVTGTSNYSWAFVFVRNDGVRRVYTVNESTSGLSAARESSADRAPKFTGHSLPRPPK
jgi:hypothetical protein